MNTKIAKWGLGWVAVLVMACPLVWGGEAATGNEDGAVSRDAGQTKVVRNRMAEKAMATILRDLDEMVVNERMGCYAECNIEDNGTYGFGFDEIWFICTTGNQEDDMPYEYVHFYVQKQTATNSSGAPYVRFNLHKEHMTIAEGDQNGVYALQKKDKERWWNTLSRLSHSKWNDQVLLKNVVRFDIYCFGVDGRTWLDGSWAPVEFDSTQAHNCGKQYGSLANIPPATIQVDVQVTSSAAAMEGGMAIAAGQGTDLEKEGRDIMVRDAETYSIVAEPITGAAQWAHPLDHYLD
jgi:hypothetical protein